jgi:hypothetical protein
MRDRRITEELKLVTRHFGGCETDLDLSWLVIHDWPLPSGWSRPSTPLAILLPPAFPSIPPDNFYVASDLRTSSGATPGNTSSPNSVSLPPGDWLCFSWHLEVNWRASNGIERGDNLLTFCESIATRLGEVG